MREATTYHSDCVQYFVGPWWAKTKETSPTRGTLLWAFLPHVDQQATALVAVGRSEPTSHDTANYRLTTLVAKGPPPASELPVAGLPHHEGEVRIVQRAKRRPVLVISAGGIEVPKELRTGGARYQTNETLLVAPYYGVDRDGTRGGWKRAFVDRIRRAEYPQYVWDKLPIHGPEESILRLDHLQPLGKHGANYELTGWSLSEDALVVLGEWLLWLVEGHLSEASVLLEFRSGLVRGANGP